MMSENEHYAWPKYNCPRAYRGNGGGCVYGGNKRFNYGFVSGTASYCRLNNKFLDAFSGCPKDEQALKGGER